MKSTREGLCFRMGLPWEHLAGHTQRRIDAVIAEHPNEDAAFDVMQRDDERWRAARQLARAVLDQTRPHDDLDLKGRDANLMLDLMAGLAKKVLGE